MAKRSARTVWLNNVCTLTVSVVASQLQVSGEKRFWGLSCKDHGNKPWKSGVTACEQLSRYVDLASQIDITSTHPVSSLVQDWMGCLHPLLVKWTREVKPHPLEQGLTNTHTPSAPIISRSGRRTSAVPEAPSRESSLPPKAPQTADVRANRVPSLLTVVGPCRAVSCLY